MKAQDLVPEVRKMYASAMKRSSRFADEFRTLWKLEPSFTFGPGDEA